MSYNVFVPKNPFTLNFLFFVYTKLRSTFGELLSFWYVGEFSLILLNLLGLWNLFFKTKVKLGFLLLLPVLIHLVLSYFKMYPFDSRLILYQVPFILVVCAFGFDFCLTKYIKEFASGKQMLRPTIMMFLAFFAWNLFSKKSYPIKNQEVRSCIEYVNLNSNNEPIYVSYFAKQPFEFYQKINIAKSAKFFSDSGEIDKFKDELEKMPKGLGWYLFSNNSSDRRRRKFFLEFCDNNSSNIVKHSEFVGAFVYLVDVK
jgi:hypothetical protein